MSFPTLPLLKFNKPSAGTGSSTVFFVLLLLRTPPLPPHTTYIYHSRVVPRPSYFTFLFLRFPIIDIQLRTLFRYILTQTQAALALARTTLLRVVRVFIPLVTLLPSCDSYRLVLLQKTAAALLWGSPPLQRQSSSSFMTRCFSSI